MNKATTVWIIIAVVLIICGAMLFVVSGKSLGWDFKKLSNKKLETNAHDVSENFESIVIETDCADIRLVHSYEGACRVVCREYEKAKHTVSVIDGTLTISGRDERNWKDRISFFNFETPEVTVYLPGSEYEALTVDATTGDVILSEKFSFVSANVKATTGDVFCTADVAEQLDIRLSTGDIELEDVNAGNIKLRVSTGDIDAHNVNCTGDISAELSTGDLELERVRCKNLYAEGTTGSIELDDLIAENELTAKMTTGDVGIEFCDAAKLYLKATTGDIYGSVLTDKIFIASATTGKVRVPSTTSGGVCELKTTTGNISISIK